MWLGIIADALYTVVFPFVVWVFALLRLIVSLLFSPSHLIVSVCAVFERGCGIIPF